MYFALLAAVLAAQPADNIASPRATSPIVASPAVAPIKSNAADVAVVCPEAFREALAPWLEFRLAQGHRVTLVSNLGSADEIRRRIRAVAEGGRLRFVLLIGEGKATMYQDPELRARCVPMHYAKARVNVLWGSQPTLSTDNWYVQSDADTDANPRPGVAIGRLTANSPEDLRRIVSKILAYERSTDFGPWRRQLNFVAGVGGFGALADMALESAAQYFLTETIPADYHLSMTYGSWRSPYCPDPRKFHRTTLDRLNEGSLFWIYIGHGYHLGLDEMRVPGKEYPILEVADADTLRCAHGRPIALFLSCYAGAIDAQQDCLAEVLLRSPGGPVAVLAGTRVTMPYAMTVMTTNLTDQWFRTRCATLGEAVLQAKLAMLAEPRAGDPRRAMLDTIAWAISPSPNNLSTERAEHVMMFNLIGDPLMSLRHPEAIEIKTPATIAAGQSVSISGKCPVEGRGTLELVLRRDRLSLPRPDRGTFPRTSEELSKLQTVYEQANDRRLTSVEVEIRDGQFAARLDVPRSASGPCHVCMYVAGAKDFASGSVDVRIQPPK